MSQSAMEGRAIGILREFYKLRGGDYEAAIGRFSDDDIRTTINHGIEITKRAASAHSESAAALDVLSVQLTGEVAVIMSFLKSGRIK